MRNEGLQALALATVVALSAVVGPVALTGGVAAAGNAGTGAIVVDDDPGPGVAYTSIQDAIDAAGTGDTIEVRAGVYAEDLDVAKERLTIVGNGSVTIDTSAASSYGIEVTADGVTFRNLRVVGPASGSSGYGFKIAGTGAPAPISVTLEDVTVSGSARSEIDLNNVRGATLRNVVADGNGTAGVGVGLTATQDVLLDDVTTTDNAWGGVGLYSYRDGFHRKNTSNVTIENSDLRESNPLYSDEEFGGTLGDLYAPGYDFAVENDDFRDGIDDRGEDFVFFQDDRASAAAYARALAHNDSSTVRAVVRDGSGEIDLGSTFVVEAGMSIQTALDRVPTGGTVEVGPGTYNETLRFAADGVTLRGTGATIAPKPNLTSPYRIVDTNTHDDATIRGFTIVGENNTGSPVIVGVTVNGEDGTVRDLVVRNVLTGVQTSRVGSDGGTIENVTAVDVGVGISTQGNATVTDSRIENVSMSGAGIRSGTTANYAGNEFVDVDGPAVSISDYPGHETTDGHVVLRRNDLSGGQEGVDNKAGVLDVDARENYWGAPSGPSGGFGGFGVSVSGNVSVDPFYTDAGMTTLSNQSGSTADIVVDDDGPSDFTTIGAAISAASAGDEILVASGTYDENVVIDVEDVILVGPNVGVPGVGDRSDEAVVEGQFAVEADGVTIDGFAFEGTDTIPEDANGFTNTIVFDENRDVIGNLTIRNSILDGEGAVTRAVQLTTIDSGPITIEDTAISGYFLGINGYGDDVTLRDSVLTDIGEGGVNLQQGDDLRVLNSTIEVGDDHDGNRYAVRFGYTMTSEGQPRDANMTVRDSVLTVEIGATDQYRRAGVIVRNSSIGHLEVSESVVSGLINDAETPVRATHNYWGSSDGPGGVGPGTGHSVSTNVTFSPFYVDAGRTTLASVGSETRTSFTVSDTTPLNTEVVDVAVTVENVGSVRADRTITLIVDGAAVGSRTVTVGAGKTRTVTFERRFKVGTHTVTINDSVVTLAEKTVVAKRATNPNAGVEITSPNAGDVSATGDVTVEYDLADADEGIAAVNYSVAGGPSGQITDLGQSSVALTGLAEGEHTMTMTLVDNLGNELSSDSVTFAVDTTEPIVEVDPTRTGAIGSNRAVEIDLTVSDDHPGSATFVVRNGSGDVYTEDLSDELDDGSETIEWDGTDDSGDPLSSGDYDLVLNATDEAGNANETTATVGVDNDPASVSAVTPNATSLGGGDTLAVDVTASDADSGVQNVTVTLAGVGVNFRTTADAAYQSGPWVATFDADELPIDGNYTVSATATDAADNPGTGSAPDEVDVDTTAPTVSAIIDTKDASTGYVNVTVSDDVAGPGSIDFDLTNESGDSLSVTGLTQIGTTTGKVRYSGTFPLDGGTNDYDLEANATDAAGNLGTTTATANITADLSGSAGDSVTITGKDGTQVVLNFNDSFTGGLAAFTSSDTPLAELGTNVGSTFLNGELNQNLADALDNATIRIPVENNVPPGVDAEDVNISRYDEVDDEWDLLPTVIETIDGEDYFVTTVEHFSTYGPVVPDNVAPSIDDSSPTSGRTYAYATSSVTAIVEYSDNKQVDASAVEVRYDGTDVTNDADTSISATKATFTARNLVGSGQHWVNVTVVDTANNVQTENVSFTVTEDTAAPSVSLTDDSFAYGTDPVPLEFTYSDALSGVDKASVALEVDGTDVTSSATVTTSRVRYSAAGLGSGTHTANLTVSDETGNSVSVSETFRIAADTDDPTVTGRTFSPSLSGGSLPAGTTQATITIDYGDATSGVDTGAVVVRFDGADVTDEAVVTSSELTYTAIGLENGTAYTFEADVVDNEGNDVTESVSFEVASPTSDGVTSGRSGGRDRSSPPIQSFDDLGDGRASVDLAGSVSRVEVDFGGRTDPGSVTVRSLSSKPDAVPDVPDATGVAYVDVTVPESLENAPATLRLTVDAAAVGDAAPSTLVVYRYTDGAWTALETTVVSASGETIVLEAATPGFSLFAVAAAGQGTATATPPGTTTQQPTGTSTPAGGTTAGTTAEAPGADTPAEPSPTTTVEPAGFDWPRVVFVGAVVLAILALLVFARRR